MVEFGRFDRQTHVASASGGIGRPVGHRRRHQRQHDRNRTARSPYGSHIPFDLAPSLEALCRLPNATLR
jgi:hypothetical protein